MVLFVPLTTLRVCSVSRPVRRRTGSARPRRRSRSSTGRRLQVEGRLTALGYDVVDEITCVATRDDVAANRSIATTIGLLGSVIVAISRVGLATL